MPENLLGFSKDKDRHALRCRSSSSEVGTLGKMGFNRLRAANGSRRKNWGVEWSKVIFIRESDS
jgi:hypothetical protein